jgi:hypothetical protein
MKRFRAIVLGAASLAAVSSNSQATEKLLPPGRPAGVNQAAHSGHLLLTLGVATVLVGALAIAISSSNKANAPAATGTAP